MSHWTMTWAWRLTSRTLDDSVAYRFTDSIITEYSFVYFCFVCSLCENSGTVCCHTHWRGEKRSQINWGWIQKILLGHKIETAAIREYFFFCLLEKHRIKLMFATYYSATIWVVWRHRLLASWMSSPNRWAGHCRRWKSARSSRRRMDKSVICDSVSISNVIVTPTKISQTLIDLVCDQYSQFGDSPSSLTQKCLIAHFRRLFFFVQRNKLTCQRSTWRNWRCATSRKYLTIGTRNAMVVWRRAITFAE